MIGIWFYGISIWWYLLDDGDLVSIRREMKENPVFLVFLFVLCELKLIKNFVSTGGRTDFWVLGQWIFVFLLYFQPVIEMYNWSYELSMRPCDYNLK